MKQLGVAEDREAKDGCGRTGEMTAGELARGGAAVVAWEREPKR